MIANRFVMETGSELTFDIATDKTLSLSGIMPAFASPTTILAIDPDALNFTGGGNLFIGNVSPGFYDFGGDVQVAIGALVDFLNNNAYTNGGAIYMSASSGTTDVTSGTNTHFKGNKAPNGGAVYYSGKDANLTVQGNTYFEDNIAANNSGIGNGGAIYVTTPNGGTAILNLDATSGHIAFRGNTAGGNANSIHLRQNTTLNISGVDNVYFDDPIIAGGGGQEIPW